MEAAHYRHSSHMQIRLVKASIMCGFLHFVYATLPSHHLMYFVTLFFRDGHVGCVL